MFRFTIRDLLWVMVVVGLAIGWWNEHRKFEAYREISTDAFKALKVRWRDP